VAKHLARHFVFGRSRVLNPVPPDQVWVFFHIVVCLISQIRRMLGQYQRLSTYHLLSAPILTVPTPNHPVSVAEKALGSLRSPTLFGGNERCILSFPQVIMELKMQPTIHFKRKAGFRRCKNCIVGCIFNSLYWCNIFHDNLQRHGELCNTYWRYIRASEGQSATSVTE
jgi:hypothetical protein